MTGNPACTDVPIQRKGEAPTTEPDCSKDAASRKMYDDVANATAKISIGGKVGSGFFVNDGSQVVTNAHVVMGQYGLGQVVATDGKKYSARIEKLDDIHDLAVLKLENNEHHSKTLQVGTSADQKPGDPAFALGHPKGLEKTYVSPGTFTKQSSFRAVIEESPRDKVAEFDREIADAAKEDPVAGKDLLEYFRARRIELDMHIDHGNSGGPVVGANEKVVGVSVNGSEMRTDAAWAVPAEEVRNLLDAKNNKFDFDYQKVSLWRSNPIITSALMTGYTGIAMGLPRFGAGALAGIGMLNAPDEFRTLLDDKSSASEKFFSGLDLAATGTMTAGSLLRFVGRRGLSYGAIATSCALSALELLKPSQMHLVDIRRNDGRKDLPLLWNAF